MPDTLLIAAWLAGFFLTTIGGLTLAAWISDRMGLDE